MFSVYTHMDAPQVDPKSNIPRRARDLLPALDASLARLGVESVDLYQIHNPGFLSVCV